MLSDTCELVEMQSLRLSQDQSVILEALAVACDHSSSIHTVYVTYICNITCEVWWRNALFL